MLGLFNVFALLVFRRSLDASFGKVTGRCWVAFITSQFHLMFYLTRTLPNMYSFGLSISPTSLPDIVPLLYANTPSNSCGGISPPIISPISCTPKTSHAPPRPLRSSLPLRNGHPPRHNFPVPPHHRPYHFDSHHPFWHRMRHHSSHTLCARRLLFLATYPSLARTRRLLLQCCSWLIIQLGHFSLPLLLHISTATSTSQPRLHTINCIRTLPARHLLSSS